MHKISRKGAVVLGAIVSFAAALVAVIIIWKVGVTANEVPITKATNKAAQWEFRSTKDDITDKIYTSMLLYGEAGSALISLRCDRMIEINGADVPIYTLQLASSDYLGRTGYGESRSVIYRVGAEHSVNEEWSFRDKNAEQVFPLLLPSENREAEILKRISLVKEITDGKILRIRVRTYRHEDRDYTFEGRDPTGANMKLLTECAQRALKQQR